MTNFYKSTVASFQTKKQQNGMLQVALCFFLFFSVFVLQAQTTIINPVLEGGFNVGILSHLMDGRLQTRE